MSDQDPLPPSAPTNEAAIPTQKRGPLFAIFAATAVLVGAGWGTLHMIEAAKYVESDNAYVAAAASTITLLTSGTIEKVYVRETQTVKAGDPLVTLESKDALLALRQAEAALDQTRRQVSTLYAQDSGLEARVAAAEAQTKAAEAQAHQARVFYTDRLALKGTGAVSDEELLAAKSAAEQADARVAAARSEMAAAQSARNANAALMGNTGVNNNPQVEAAQLRVEQARLEYERTQIKSPIAGVVTGKKIDEGNRMAAGTPVMTIVPIDDAYVYVNLKEVQLKNVRVGQTVELVSDTYGQKVVFHGRISGISGGTGSAFAIIPAQNATGNWIKVVQRVPVRVELDPQELKIYPLRVGMSMKARIRIKDK